MYNSFIELRGTVEHITRLQFDQGESVVRLSTKTFNDVFKILNTNLNFVPMNSILIKNRSYK